MENPYSGRDVEALVESQVRRWIAAKEKRREDALAPTANATPVPTVLTISRAFGSRGAEIGRDVAAQLSFDVWDQQIIRAIAKESDAREALLATVDERARGGIQQLIAALRGNDGAQLEYGRRLTHVVRSVAHHGAAVIIGRGGQFIVAPEAAFRVRIIQPLDERVADYASRHDVPPDRARDEIVRVEKERASFCRQQFDADVTLPTHYDLVVNRTRKSTSQTTAIIVAAYRALHGLDATRKDSRP